MTREVGFRQYREYEERRKETSNALMALLAGSQLAAHFLALTDGSTALLPEVFPHVAHIKRVNLTSNRARSLLDDAEEHLCAMGVPYALAIHEDLMKTFMALLGAPAKAVREKRAAGQHKEVERLTGESFDADHMIELDTIRKMRNCTIHAGGTADDSLVNYVRDAWTPNVRQAWLRLASDPAKFAVGDPVRFGHGELMLSLAVTKEVAREANVMLQKHLPRNGWADLVVEDLLADDPKALLKSDAKKKIRGRARLFGYDILALTDIELADAARRA